MKSNFQYKMYILTNMTMKIIQEAQKLRNTGQFPRFVKKNNERPR